MPVQAVLIPHAIGLDLHLGDLLDIILVVDAVSQYVSKIAQRPLERISGALLLGLLKRFGLARAVLNVTVPDILVECAVTQGDPHNHRQAQRYLQCLRVFVAKVHGDGFDGGRPAVEAENLVGERNAFLRGDVVHLGAAGPGAL